MLKTRAQREFQARVNAKNRATDETIRQIATLYFGLHEVCDLPVCRRARRCVGAGLPRCILDKKAHYMHLLPALREAMEQELERRETAGVDLPGTTPPAVPPGRDRP